MRSLFATIAVLFAISLPVLATTETGPLIVTVTTSPNPYAIKGLTEVPNSQGILGVGVATKDVALEGTVNQPSSVGLEGFAQSTTGNASNGVFGYAANGAGVYGVSTSESYASVYGVNNTTGGSGVFGTAAGAAVYGTSSGSSGVYGQTTSTNTNAGVFGENQSAASGFGIYGESTTSTGYGVVGSENQGGFAVDARSTDGTAYHATAGQGVKMFDGESVGTDSFAYEAFTITSGLNQSGYAKNSAGESVDLQINGDVYLTGRVYDNCSFYPPSNSAGSCAPPLGTMTATAPRLSSDGEGMLVAGHAYVTLEPALVQNMRSDRPYRVFLTPEGDTRGLYVTQKSTRGFVVREAQGGRSSIAFDYRILAEPRARVPLTASQLRAATAHRPALEAPHRPHAPRPAFAGTLPKP